MKKPTRKLLAGSVMMGGVIAGLIGIVSITYASYNQQITIEQMYDLVRLTLTIAGIFAAAGAVIWLAKPKTK